MVPINYLAVLVCGIVSMGLGMAWYGPIFGKQWIAEMGWTPEHMEAMKHKSMTMTYVIQFIGALLMAFVLAHMVIFANAYLSMTGFMAGVLVGFLNWIGFVAPATVGMVLWEGKSWKLWLLTAGYFLALLVIMGAILAA